MKFEQTYKLLSGILVGFGLVFGFLIWKHSYDYTKALRSLFLNVGQSPSNTLEPIPTPLISTRILFVGDMMFDRNIRLAGQKNGYDFILSPMTEILTQYDAVVGNLETPITTNPSMSVGSAVGSPKNFVFTSDPLIMETLKKNNITIVNLGNNHINNFGEEGYIATIDYLESAGIEYFGHSPYTSKNPYIIKEFGQIAVGFVNYNQFIDDGYEKALMDIKAAREAGADVLVLVAHWDNEYETTPAPITVQRAHAFVDAGADVVIGAHQHVVAEIEDYQGKKIFYSLGNFVFDQYFSEETRIGLAVGMTIDPTNYELTFEMFETVTERDGSTHPRIR